MRVHYFFVRKLAFLPIIAALIYRLILVIANNSHFENMKSNMSVNRNFTEIRISPSFSAPRITCCDENASSPLETSNLDNNNPSTSTENFNSVKLERLSPPLMNAQLRPYSNSVCTSLLTPDLPKRSQMHRASDGLLMSDSLRQKHEHRQSQIRTSVIDQELYWKTNEGMLF